MKSAHSDERNLAHCAATAMSSPKQVSNHELTKLKEDYERQIQTLKLEHKIQLLEMDNKISKQILELQKENQSLKHENEMMKLKSAHDLQSNKMVVDANLEKQMVAKELELKDILNEKDKEIAEKDKDLLNLQHKHEIETIKMKNEMEKTIESLRNENEILKTKVKKEQPKEMDQSVGAVTMKEEVEDPLRLPLMERLEWGVKCFITIPKPHTPFNGNKYQEWYENIANGMEDKKLYRNENFLFMRKDFGVCHSPLRFINHDIGKEFEFFVSAFEVKGLDISVLNRGEFVLFHPKDSQKFSRTKQNIRSRPSIGMYNYWEFHDVPADIFFGPDKTAIVCWVSKDN